MYRYFRIPFFNIYVGLLFMTILLVAVLQLLGRSSGFQVASTHRPCTKGLWMWSAPIKRTALDGTEYNLLLLDSEGIDAYDQTVRIDTFQCYLVDDYMCSWILCM